MGNFFASLGLKAAFAVLGKALSKIVSAVLTVDMVLWGIKKLADWLVSRTDNTADDEFVAKVTEAVKNVEKK